MESFRISGLPAGPFAQLFGLNDADLAARGIFRLKVDRTPGFPDRIELRDLEPGETALLLNYVHQDADTPYRASHAIFIREGATQTYDRIGHVPHALRLRPLSLRAFSAEGSMLEAELVAGTELEAALPSLFADPAVAYIHAHYAKRGCYAARIDRYGATLLPH